MYLILYGIETTLKNREADIIVRKKNEFLVKQLERVVTPYYFYLIIEVTLVVVIITLVKRMIRNGIIVRLKYNNEVILWVRTWIPLRSSSAYRTNTSMYFNSLLVGLIDD